MREIKICYSDKANLGDAINPYIENEVAKENNGKTLYDTWIEEAQALFISLGDNAKEENPEDESGDLD